MIEYIINGIPDDPIGKTILYEATKLDELKVKLKMYEKIRDQRKLTSNTKTFSKKSQQSDSNETSYSSSKAVRCFICGSKSHVKNDCPDQAKGFECFKCNGFGHRAKECQSSKANAVQPSEQPKPIRNISAAEQDEAKVKIRHENNKIDGTIDSGKPRNDYEEINLRVVGKEIDSEAIAKTFPGIWQLRRGHIGCGGNTVHNRRRRIRRRLLRSGG